MSLYDMGLAVYRQMGTFEDIHVTQYENYAKKQAEKLKQVKENIKAFGDEVKTELEERKEELMEDHRHE